MIMLNLFSQSNRFGEWHRTKGFCPAISVNIPEAPARPANPYPQMARQLLRWGFWPWDRRVVTKQAASLHAAGCAKSNSEPR